MYRNNIRTIILFLLIFSACGFAQDVSIFSDQDTTLANSYFTKAEQLRQEAKHDSSIFYFEEASVLWGKQTTINNVPKCWEKVVQCYNQIGENYLVKSEYANALELGLKKFGENHPLVATSYDFIGLVYREKGEIDKALKYCRKALTIRRSVLGENHPDIASSYQNIGLVHVFQSHPDIALEYFSKALSLREQLFGENSLPVAECYYGMARANYYKRDTEALFKHANRALSLILHFVDEMHPTVADIYNDLGNYYYYTGDYDQALMIYEKSLNISLRIFGQYHRQVSRSYVNIAHCYTKKGDYSQSLVNHKKALLVFQKLFGENHWVASAYQYIGEVYESKGDMEMAIEYFQRALTLFQRLELEGHPQAGRLNRSIGEIYARKQDYQTALRYYQKSLMSFVPTFTEADIYQNPAMADIAIEFHLLLSLAAKADAFFRVSATGAGGLKALIMSQSTYNLAVELIEKMRRGYSEEGTKLWLSDIASKIYHGGIATSLQIYEVAKDAQHLQTAFSIAEKSKAAILYQSIQESLAKQFAGIPQALLEKERTLRIDLANCETEIQIERQQKTNGQAVTILALEDRYFILKREHEKLIEQFEHSYPRYYDLKYKSRTASHLELQLALDEKTAVVEYILSDRAIYIFTITQNRFHVSTIRKELAFDTLSVNLGHALKSISAKSDYIESAARLYKILIEPIATQIADKPRWVIIPDGELYQVPFEALLSKPVASITDADYRKLDYLIKQHEISYHYSATLFLKSLQDRSADHFVYDFAGFAPVFSKSANNGNLLLATFDVFKSVIANTFPSLVTRAGNLIELEYSEEEIRAIHALFPKGHSRAFLHQDASENNFKNKAGDYKYLHIATHGFIQNEFPKLSNLAFSQPQDSTAKEDGILYSGETYNLDLDADLLVLSSCDSGAGKLARGEGVMALTRGFLYSGARNIIASLWNVYDQHTSLLMVELYRQILSGKSYAAALRAAKLKMIADEATAGPQSWASFVLIGR